MIGLLFIVIPLIGIYIGVKKKCEDHWASVAFISVLLEACVISWIMDEGLKAAMHINLWDRGYMIFGFILVPTGIWILAKLVDREKNKDKDQ